jgi:hypothetical protein
MADSWSLERGGSIDADVAASDFGAGIGRGARATRMPTPGEPTASFRVPLCQRVSDELIVITRLLSGPLLICLVLSITRRLFLISGAKVRALVRPPSNTRACQSTSSAGRGRRLTARWFDRKASGKDRNRVSIPPLLSLIATVAKTKSARNAGPSPLASAWQTMRSSKPRAIGRKS